MTRKRTGVLRKRKAATPDSKRLGTNRQPRSLEADQAYAPCATHQFKFRSTNQLNSNLEFIAQARAVRAINLGLGIRKPGYNIYVAGIQGTGKTSVIRSFLEKWSADAPIPNDWVYVYDFESNENTRAISLSPGQGRRFKKIMEELIKALKQEIPLALQSEDYENAVNSYISTSNESKSKLFSVLEKRAKEMGFQIKSTRMGIETIPVVDGRALSEKDYGKLGDEKRGQIEKERGKLEPEVLDFARKIRSIEQQAKEYVEAIRHELGKQVVGVLVEPCIEQFKDNQAVVSFLNQVSEQVIENMLDFVEDEDHADHEQHIIVSDERDKFQKYRVNVFVDNTHTQGAPVILESNPTYYNLFGRIEKNVENGMYLTDFTMIKCGAMHRANGGYLVLNAPDVFRNATIWEMLKRVLKSRRGFIEDLGEQYSLLPTSGLRPEPIPLNLKVVLIGNDEIYHLLYDYDEDFHKIFKVKADFDGKMPRNRENIASYAEFVATRSQVENLLPFDRSGVATIVEFGSRLVEDQRLLSTQFAEIKDLTIEADFIAREKGATVVKRSHVEDALDQKYFRLSLIEDHLLEMVKNEDILLTVEGTKSGQVNGLSVLDMGDFEFGKIGRITCSVSSNDDGFFNIDRASKLSGKIHDKGMLILSSYLSSLLAKGKKCNLSASVCFEQSYGMIDGDSASIAELVAIVSALSGIPVNQSFAMTGSINQLGEVQPVGGINAKIEGLFKALQILGRDDGHYYVMIPHQNVPNLVLHRDVRRAIKSGFLTIYPIKHVVEAFELATRREFGLREAAVGKLGDSDFIPGSALDIISRRMAAIGDKKGAKPLNHDVSNRNERPKRAARSIRSRTK